MSSNNNTRSTKINAFSNTIENQLSKQPITKLFKNLEETEAEELNIDSAAQEVEEMLKNYRNMKNKIIPAPLYASDTGDRTEKIMVMVMVMVMTQRKMMTTMTVMMAMTVIMTMNLTTIFK